MEIQKELFDKNEKAIKKVNDFIDSLDWQKFESQNFVRPKPLTNDNFHMGLVFGDFDANHVLKHDPHYILSKPCNDLTFKLLWYNKFQDGKKNGLYIFMLFYDGQKWMKFKNNIYFKDEYIRGE